jgi:hypothetical protein
VSLLDNPPHTATVYLEETVVDSRGQQVRQPSNKSVEIACLVMPLGSRRDSSIGQRHEETYSLVSRDTTSITEYARVTYDGIAMSVASIEHHASSPDDDVHEMHSSSRGVTCNRARCTAIVVVPPWGIPDSGKPRPGRDCAAPSLTP